MLNKVLIIGNLTRDPAVKYTANGTAVCDLGVATSRVFNSGGEKKTETTFVDVTVWGKQAETCGQYLQKGRRVLIEGRLRLETWETDGQKRSKLGVVADRVNFLGPNNGNGKAQNNPEQESEVNSEDIPF